MSNHQQYFETFVVYANAGQYRDALLALEEVWKSDRDEFYAGILQLLVALNQLHSGLQPRRTLQRARERITPYAPTYKGLDVPHLLAVIDACNAILPEQEGLPLTGEIPQLRIVMEE